MYRAKQRWTTLLLACFAVLVSVLLALTLWTAPTDVRANAASTTVTDTLNRETTEITNTTYASWSGKTSTSTAVYAGQSAGGNESIQLRSSNSNSGIVTTASGGKIKKVTVDWNSNTASGRTLNVYGKDTAYTSPTELYNTATAGTKIGTIVNGTSTVLEINEDYAYVGVRSNSGAMYLTSISFTWEVEVASACEHTNKELQSTTAPTCTTAGQNVYTCPDCSENITEEIEALGHDQKETITPASCTAVGEKTISCSRCDFKTTEEIPMIAHNYVNGVCDVCGAAQPSILKETLAIIANTGTLAADSLSISWTGNNIKFINEKAGSSTAIRTSDSTYYRVYANSQTTISTVDEENITQVVITCTSSEYASVCQTSATNAGYTATVSGNDVTITVSEAASSITFTASAQWRLNQIVVSYEKTATSCEHTYEIDEENSKPATCTEKGLQIEICSKCNDVRETEPPALGHVEVHTIISEATCQAAGSKTITCENCSELNETVELPLLPHDYQGGKCSVCGETLPAQATLTFDDKAKRTELSTEKQVWTENSIILTNDKADCTTPVADYAAPVRFYKSSTLTIEYPQMFVIVFACDTEAYATALKTSIGDTATSNGESVTVKFAEPQDSFTITLSGQVRMDSLTVATEPTINSASVTIGEDITLNCYVTIANTLYADATLVFTMNDNNLDVKGELTDGRYKFSLELPPQYMTDTVQVFLYHNNVLMDQIENYSIQTYAINQLEKASEEDTELKRLLSDMLHYGAAAQEYKGYKTETLANNVDGILAETADVPTTTDFTLSEVANDCPAYFTGAGVYFDNVNKLYVKLSTTENVTLTINGTQVENLSTKIYTDGISVTEFDTPYTFVLSYDDGNGQTATQTLTYSINAYAYAKKDAENVAMKNLALALYHYGVSAEAYAA